jgi:hypothetical protein
LKKLLILLLALFIPYLANGQVLTTAETGGKNNQAVMLSENRIFVDGIQLNIAYAEYVRGLTKRFDLYASIGNTTIFGENQAWIGIGGNLHLFRVEKVDVSFFNVGSVPVQRPKNASTVLLNSAIVVSRGLTKSITAYSGVNGLFPIGAKERGFFTPTTKKLNVPVGAAISHKKWLIFIEADIGHLSSAGIGIAHSL